MEDLLRFLLNQPPLILLFAGTLFALLEYLIPPVPGDTVALLVCIQASQHKLLLLYAFLLLWLASTIGGYLAYRMGKVLGPPILSSWVFSYLGKRRLEKAKNLVHNHGFSVLWANRFFPGVRGVMMPLAGIFHLPAQKVLAISAIANLLWFGLLLGAGWMVGNNLNHAEKVLQSYNLFILGLLCLYLLWRFLRSRRSS